MSKKLYIGNLPYSIDDEGLQELFGQTGTVESAKVITDRESGRSKGFGFVEMSSSEEAEKAISKFDGYELDGRPIRVSEAKPQESRGGDRGGRHGGGGGRRGGGDFGGGRGDHGGGGYRRGR